MSDLERQLTQLGHEIDWPPTPDLATSIADRLGAAPADRLGTSPAVRGRRRFVFLPPAGFRRSLAIAVVALLVLAGGVFAAVPSVRDAVLEFFGLQGATVERREHLPPAPATRLPDVGRPTTLARAPEQLGFEPLVPRSAGEPEGVFVDGSVP